MSPNFEEYCRKLQTEVDAIEQQAEDDVRLDHLRAFNFGRSLGRVENARNQLLLRVRWTLFGAAVGVAAAAVYLQAFLNPRNLGIIR